MFGLFRKKLAGFAVDWAEKTSKGGRDSNQDRCAAAWTRCGFFCAAMADGLGGHAQGDLAASIAVDTVTAGLRDMAEEDAESALPMALQAAHAAISELAGGDNGAKSTCVALLLAQGNLHLASVGDSRLYLAREGRIEALTKDHSVVQLLVDSGQIEASEASRHPDRNRLYQSLGTGGALRVQASGQGLPMRNGDVLLLCTDGFWQYLDAAEAIRCLGHRDWPARRRLHELFGSVERKAAQDPRHDNLTAQVVCLT